MSWSSGVFTRFFGSTGWQDDKAAATKILASRHDSHDQDLAQGLNVLLGNLQLNAHFKVGSVAGTNTVTGTLSPALTSYGGSMYVVIIPSATNTGATTLNLNGLGALAVQSVDGAACVGGELVINIPALLLLNAAGTAWILQAPANLYKKLRRRQFSVSETLAVTDVGRSVNFTGAAGQTVTLTAGMFSNDDVITLLTTGSGSLALTATTPANLFWFNGSATPTGARTIVAAGAWINIYVADGPSGTFFISGTGIS